MVTTSPGDATAHATGNGAALHCSVLAVNRLYVAVHVVNVRRALCLLCKGVAEVVAVEDGAFMTYDLGDWIEVGQLRREFGEFDDAIEDWIHGVNFSIQAPRIIRLLDYDRIPKNTVKFNRRNVFLRDGYRCQYCDDRFTYGQLSLDHVVPRSRGGETSWTNIVTSCLDCNVRKGGRTPREARMPLVQQPVKPRRNPLLNHQVGTEKYACWQTFLR